MATQVFLHEVIRRRRLDVCEEDGTATLGRYSAFDCVQGVVDVRQFGWVEAVAYAIVCAGVWDDGPGPVVFYAIGCLEREVFSS